MRQNLPGRLPAVNHKAPKVCGMRIYGPNGTTLGGPLGNARRAGSGAFALPDAGAAGDARAAAPPRAAGTIDALLALQGVEDPVERRKRSVKRGNTALDVLDAEDRSVVRRARRHDSAASQRGGRPERSIRRSRPRSCAGRDRASRRGRTRQGERSPLSSRLARQTRDSFTIV